MHWPCRGKALSSLLEIWSAFMFLSSDTNFYSCRSISCETWLIKFARLADIFANVKSVNLSLEGLIITVLGSHNTIYASSGKQDLFAEKLQNINYGCFKTFKLFVVQNDYL
jgi:hypothetical protein